MSQGGGGNWFLKGCLIATGTIILLGVVGFVACAALVGTAVNEAAKEQKAEVERMQAAPVTDITWEEIDAIYNVRSNSTELQKKEHWKHYKGQKVKWTGEVSSVGETFGTLQLQIKMNAQTLTSDLIISLKPAERQKAVKLSEGDIVTFVGILNDWGTIMPISLNHGEIISQ